MDPNDPRHWHPANQNPSPYPPRGPPMPDYYQTAQLIGHPPRLRPSQPPLFSQPPMGNPYMPIRGDPQPLTITKPPPSIAGTSDSGFVSIGASTRSDHDRNETPSVDVHVKAKRRMKRFDFPCRNLYIGTIKTVEAHDGTVFCADLQSTLLFSTCTATKRPLDEHEDMINEQDFRDYVQKGESVFFNIYPSTQTIRRFVKKSEVRLCVARIVKFSAGQCISSCVLHGEYKTPIESLNTRTTVGQAVVTILGGNDALCLATVIGSDVPLGVYACYVSANRVDKLRQCFVKHEGKVRRGPEWYGEQCDRVWSIDYCRLTDRGQTKKAPSSVAVGFDDDKWVANKDRMIDMIVDEEDGEDEGLAEEMAKSSIAGTSTNKISTAKISTDAQCQTDKSEQQEVIEKLILDSDFLKWCAHKHPELIPKMLLK